MDVKEFKARVIPLTVKIYPLAMRYLEDASLAEDAVQEIMIKLWSVRKQLAKHPNMNGFALLTAKNYCVDLVRKNKPTLVRDAYLLSTLASDSTGIPLEEEELTNYVTRLINGLPPQQREVMILKTVDGLSYTEIEALTNLKVSHIRVLVSRARQRIAEALQKTYS